MKQKNREASIQYCLTESIVKFVLVPLFLALAVLCFLLQSNLEDGTKEAYQMMFEQNVKEIDSAILKSSYASSTMITYTESSKLLNQYYYADSEYEKFREITHLMNMISNCEISLLGDFQGEMLLLMNDGRLIDSSRTQDISGLLPEYDWHRKIQAAGQRPYWDNAMNQLFQRHDAKEYVVFGRKMMRYQEKPLGYAIVRIPKTVFYGYGSDMQYEQGSVVMFSPDGRILTGEDSHFSGQTLQSIYDYWKSTGVTRGRYNGSYYMISRLSNSSNVILYLTDDEYVFGRSERIMGYVMMFMLATGIGLLWVATRISKYITEPILFFADRINQIEQNRPEQIMLKEHRFQEIRVLEEGMLRAQKRITALVEDVRREAGMKERALFDALKAQINPHFLFNTLNAIRWKATMNRDEEVADILSELGVLLSETYRNADELETIENAVRVLDAYVKIMQVRFGDKVQFFFVIPDQIKEYQIPRFCLQPLVENSFIHGMSHVENGVIALRGEMIGSDIVLTLIDNGVGLQSKNKDILNENEAKKRGITGIGLSNIHKRIQLLFGEEYGLSIDTELEVGFKISLRIPARKAAGAETGQDE